jgi:hypothetical protein
MVCPSPLLRTHRTANPLSPKTPWLSLLRCIRQEVTGRADLNPYRSAQFNVCACEPAHGEEYVLVKKCGQRLIKNRGEVVNKALLYRNGV